MKFIAFLAFSASFIFSFSAQKLIIDAKSQIGVTISYDPSYEKISYPMGDVSIEKGVCTDVIIRALRGQNIDLQELIHKDMRTNFSLYPKAWGAKSTDKNIDHRRVLNIATYLKRRGFEVKDKKFLPGDIVTWLLDNKLPHIGIISDKISANSAPLVIHNIGQGTREDDILFFYKITGHFRIK